MKKILGLDLGTTSAGWATLYIGFATQLPSGLKAYIVTESSVDDNVAPLDKWENRLIGTSIGQEDKWGVPVNQGDANQGSILTLGRNSQGEVGFRKVFVNNQ